MKKTVVWTQVVALALAGCSTASKDIVPIQVSPTQYSNYDCDQIAAEQLRIHGRVTQLGGRLDEAASNDNTIGWVGGLLFWPALFWLGGTKEQEAEYARLRGEYDALQQAAIQKKCSAAMAPVQRAAPATPTAPGTSPEPTAARTITAPELAPALAPTGAAVQTAKTSPTQLGSNLPQVGTTWNYTFEDTLYRSKYAFTVRLAAVTGSMFNELFQVGDDTSRSGPIDAEALTFVGRQLVAGQRLIELAPYVLTATNGVWPSSSNAPAGYPLDGSAEPFRTRVVQIVQDNVVVPAGSYKALRVEISGERSSSGFAGIAGGQMNSLGVTRFRYTVWYAEGVHRYVMARHQQWNATGVELSNELVRLNRHTAK